MAVDFQTRTSGYWRLGLMALARVWKTEKAFGLAQTKKLCKFAQNQPAYAEKFIMKESSFKALVLRYIFHSNFFILAASFAFVPMYPWWFFAGIWWGYGNLSIISGVHNVLYVVATPIGNLGDISFRALEILNSCDYILSEDTRVFRKLADRYEIKTRVVSFHSHSSEAKLNEIVEDIKSGKQVALVSDAGTPLISDPGFSLVSALRKNGLEVSPIPGATSIVAALSACGFPADKFMYLGFFPAKKGRQTLCKKMAASEYTCVFLESVHRVKKTLAMLSEFLDPEQMICVGRELTKIHEEFVFMRASEGMPK